MPKAVNSMTDKLIPTEIRSLPIQDRVNSYREIANRLADESHESDRDDFKLLIEKGARFYVTPTSHGIRNAALERVRIRAKISGRGYLGSFQLLEALDASEQLYFARELGK